MKNKMMIGIWLAFFLILPLQARPQEGQGGTVASPPQAEAASPAQHEQGAAALVGLKKFSLSGKNRLVPETAFSIQLLDEKLRDRVVGVYLHADPNIRLDAKVMEEVEKALSSKRMLRLKAYLKQDGSIGLNEVTAWLPSWKGELQGLIHPKRFAGFFKAHYAFLDIVYLSDPEGKTALAEVIAVRVPEPLWAWAWGIAVILLSMCIARLVIGKRDKHGKKFGFFKVPLLMTETPLNRYSLSLTQLLIWTYITLFGLAFVWKMTKSFMEITPQMLMLLGIGGGTAAFSRLQAASRLQDIPTRYQVLLEEDDCPRQPAEGKGNSSKALEGKERPRNPKRPRLSDIISTNDGRPNLIKYQLITFTILIACIVFVEIVNTFAFPTLSEGLIALMGLSSAVYIGNDLSKNVSEQELQAKIREIDDIVSVKSPDEIRKMLNQPGDNQKKLIEFKDLIEKYLM